MQGSDEQIKPILCGDVWRGRGNYGRGNFNNYKNKGGFVGNNDGGGRRGYGVGGSSGRG
jgi:hypothetical protein